MSQPAEGVVHTRVRYAETDQMGVVYHANYLIWCEIGRTELMRQFGYPYADVERTGIRLAVADASLRYSRAARYDDAIRIVTRVAGVQSRTVTFTYEVWRDADDGADLLVTASTKLIAIDENGATKRLPADMIERFREIAEPT